MYQGGCPPAMRFHSDDLAADVTVYRREHRINRDTDNAKVRHKYMAEFLMYVVAAQHDQTNQEKQRMAE